MRYKILFFILLILAALHFVTGTVLSNLYNTHGHVILGFPTSVNKVSVDLLNRMITMKDLSISSGTQKDGMLLTVDTVVISFRFFPLLSRKIRIDELSLNDITINFQDNQPLFEKLSQNIAAQYGIFQKSLQRAHTPDLPDATPSKPFVIHKVSHGHDVTYKIVKVAPTLLFNTIKITNVSVLFGQNDTEPLPPSVSDIDLIVRHISPEMLLATKETSFEVTGKLKDQAGSHLSFGGTCRQQKDGFSLTAVLRAQTIELPDLWPYLINIMHDQDLSTLVVNSGLIDLTADIGIENNETTISSVTKFSKFNLASAEGFEQEPLSGKDRKMIIDAINSVGDFSIEFTDYEQWKKAFREVVMKGIRNLIRKAIREKFFGR